jgi:SHS2 domain-containing protein
MYEFFEHKADIGIRGSASSLEEAFAEAAKAMFSVMVDIDKVKPVKTVDIRCSAENDEELLVEFLNKLLSEANINDMVFSEFIVRIRNHNLEATAKGESLDPEKHNVKTEVKAATYSQLKVESNEKFLVQCVVDV